MATSVRATTPTASPADTPEHDGISVSGLVKTFTRRNGERVRAVDHIELNVRGGELLVLLGPSGCGKTTLLRLLAGLEEPEDGHIEMQGTVVYDRARRVSIPPERRPASMVFQSYALWPHMTALENVVYPLASRRVPKRESTPRAEGVLEMVGVGSLRDQLPSQMSGGQQQRVALARAIVAGQGTILFDEPLSNVDAKVRDRLRLEILAMQRDLGFTAVYVTHDQEDAMTLGSRIAVMREGQVAQIGTPREVYERPNSRYVANFVGAADEIEGRVVSRDATGVLVETAVGRFLGTSTQNPDEPDVVVVVRPEAWSIQTTGTERPNCVQGVVEAAVFLGGGRTEYIVRAGGFRVRAWNHSGTQFATGASVWISAEAGDVLVFGRD
jgi:iron(III) transport system ATP-binding protein